MASTPPKTNLFGGVSIGEEKAKGGGNAAKFGSASGVIGSSENKASSSSASSSSASSWFEEDDEALLSRLLLGEDGGGEEPIDGGGDLDAGLDRLRRRLEEDLSRAASSANDSWWTAVLGAARSDGFACSLSSSSSPPTNGPSTSDGGRELPKAFNTPEGRAHLRALVDLLGVPRERAVRITLASLRSFASVVPGAAASPSAAASSSSNGNYMKEPVSTPPSASVDSDKENGGEEKGGSKDDEEDDGSSEQEARLRSLLGTRELFRRVLSRHRRQFLARLRIVTESLRLEQEGKEEADRAASPGRPGRRGVGKSCAEFLDKLDSAAEVDGKRRGLFRMLLRLAAGPPLPGMGAGELPRSVDELLRGGSGAVSNVLEGGEESLLAIRNESAEALLALLYDRVDGGVRRSDLFLVVEAAGACGECEFGSRARQSSGRVAFRRNVPGGRDGYDLNLDESSPAAVMESMMCRHDGLWALICAECMGLWRANNGNDGGGGWIGQHPFFSGLTLDIAIKDGSCGGFGGKRILGLSLQTGNTNADSDRNKQARKELEALCIKLRQLGETVRGRRQAAYSKHRKSIPKGDSDAMDTDGVSAADAAEDEELWGVRAPEAIALLALGLLLRLAHNSCPSNDFLSKLGETGVEFALTANEECGAFAYLHSLLEGMVLDPLREIGDGGLRRGHSIGSQKLVQDLIRRGEVEAAVEDRSLSLMDEGGEEGAVDKGGPLEGSVTSDAASIVYASIGREILSATIRAFRSALLSLQSPTKAVENVGMLADLAAAIHRNSEILCEQFWGGWEEFCRGGGGSGGMDDDADVELLSNAEPLCYLLDASHSLAASTLAELNGGGSGEPRAIIHYLKPLSTFLHLIASLCANSSMVQSVFTSEFLPDGLLPGVVSVIAALAPSVSSLNEAANSRRQQMLAEEVSTVRHATAAVQSISTLAYLGGGFARDWIRRSLRCDGMATGPARTICIIASQVLPALGKGSSSEHECCAALASSTLNLLVDLLVDADVAFQMDTLDCFSLSGSLNFGRDRVSGFAPYFVSGEGVHGEVTLAASSVLSCLAVNLSRNAFDAKSASSGLAPARIAAMGGGVAVALDVLSTLVSSGEVSFPASTKQVATAHSILSSVVAMLVGLKQVIYLHEDDEVRSVALTVRNEIVNSLTSSTPLGRVVAFLASAPLSLLLAKKSALSIELSQAMDAAANYREGRMDGGGRYGAWGRFLTPRRVSRKASRRRAVARTVALSLEGDVGNAREDAQLDLDDVVVMAQALLLVWGEHAEDIAEDYFSEEVVDGPDRQSLLQNSPCTLLLSKASTSSLQPRAAATALNVANLNLISRSAGAGAVLVGGSAKSDAAILSAKIVKMCLRHANATAGGDHSHHDALIRLSAFRVALGGGSHLFQVLLGAFDKLVGGGVEECYAEGTERLVLMVIVILETVAVSVKSQPDLARAILLGGEQSEDWRLVDKIVSLIMSTSDLMSASREIQNKVDNRMLNLLCLLTCACLHVVSNLWKSCRLTCKKNSNVSLESAHACGLIVSYLTNSKNAETTSLVSQVVVDLTRCSLLALMALEENNSLQDQVPTSAAHQKCILLDLLTRSLDIATIEAVSRVQTKSLGGVKFVEDLFDSGPMECWKVLLSSGDAPAASAAASSWLTGFSSSIGRCHAPNWNVASFLQANPTEQEATSTWCAFGSALRLAKDLSPAGSDSESPFRQCNALHVLTHGEASFSASWATFFELVTANVVAARPTNEISVLSFALVETTLAALVALSDSQMISNSLLSSQGFMQSRDVKPVGELCSLLLYSLTVRRDTLAADEARNERQSNLVMIGHLYEAANKLFVMTQLGSVAPSGAVCSMRQKLLSCALLLMTEFESLPRREKTREDVVKYNDLRLGFTDLSVNALQSLQYVQLGATDDIASVEDATLVPCKFGYGFGAVSEKTSPHLGQEAALQLLRASFSLICHLAPTTKIGSSSNFADYQTHTYGADFAACLKERNAMEFIQYHLSSASNVASLTYQAVHGGSSSHSVAVIHNNAVAVVRLITTLFHELVDAGSMIAGILLLLLENRCFRSLIDNPLLKTSSKTWSSNTAVSGDEVMSPITQHRGYYTSLPRHAGIMASTSKSKPSSQRDDSVHFVWREVVNIFSSLLRSARCQSQTHAKVDEPILRQTPVTSVVLDFVCTYADELFACFSSMLIEARALSNISSRAGKQKSSSFSSSIQSSSFAFTPNLLKESADISSLFAELCKRDIKAEFARQCSGIYERVLSTSLELTKTMSSFLGSIGNARELFLALSSASSTIMLDQPATMFDAHPLLAEGLPNARHEAIRNAHFAHSCCILATAEDFSNSHVATTKAAESSTGKDKSMEQSFQIQVNNKFIAEVEQVAGHCLFNAIAVLSYTHPASDSFIYFSCEEASCLDVAAVIKPGTAVAICARGGAQQYLQRYLIPLHGGDLRYARTIGCDSSTHTISVEYVDTGSVERHVPWSCIVGMEDTSKRQCIFSYLPSPKSMAEADTRGPPSLGHLILALKWCRHVGLTSLDSANNYCSMHIVKCVAERVAILLCTEVMLHEDLQERTLHDETVRRVNMQLLDLFDYVRTESEDLNPEEALPPHQGDNSLALAIGDDILDFIQVNLRRQLLAASLEKEEEKKMWEQNNSGWDNATWASSSKRQGRRSPFRLMRKTSSGDLS